MEQQIIVSLIDVEYGRNENWLSFKAYVGWLNKNRKYTLDYCGTELKHSLPLLDCEMDELRASMYKDFGSAPFDLHKAKHILGEGKDYILIRNKK